MPVIDYARMQQECLFCSNMTMMQIGLPFCSSKATIENYECPCGASKVVTMANFVGCDCTCDAEHFFNGKPAVAPKHKNAFWNPAHIVGIVPDGEPIPGSAECARKYFPHNLRCELCHSEFSSATAAKRICPVCERQPAEAGNKLINMPTKHIAMRSHEAKQRLILRLQMLHAQRILENMTADQQEN